MSRSRSFVKVAAVAAFTLLIVSSASAQPISDERIQELIREAQKTPHPTFAFTPQVPEGPRVPITVDEAVKFALENNLQLTVQRMAPELQDIAVAQAAIALRQPVLTSNVSRSSSTSTPTSQLQLAAGGAQSTTNNTLTYNASIAQPLPFWGAEVSASFNNNRRDSNSNNSTFNPSYNSNWDVNYSQPLLRGRAIDTARRGLIVSRIQRDISDVQLKTQISNLAADVRNAYWDLVVRTQAVETAQQSLEISTKQVQDNQIKVEVGTLAQIEVVGAQAEQARMRQALVQAQNARRTSELALKALIVGGTDDTLWAATLDPVDRPAFEPQTIDNAVVEAATRRALNERNDIAVARKQIEMNELSMKVLRDGLLPQVNLSVNYGVSGVGGTRLIRQNSGVLGSDVTTTVPGGIGDALSTLLRGDNPSWSVGMNINYPIGLTTQQTAMARARIQLTQNQSQLKLIELQVARDIQSAAINLRNGAEAVEVARVSRELSEQRLSAEQSKFEVGMSTNYQVILAQRDLDDARNSELNSILSYQRALVEFDRVQQNGSGASIISIN